MFLLDFQVAEFTRTEGAKDKTPRKRGVVKGTAIETLKDAGQGALGVGLGMGTLALANKLYQRKLIGRKFGSLASSVGFLTGLAGVGQIAASPVTGYLRYRRLNNPTAETDPSKLAKKVNKANKNLDKVNRKYNKYFGD